MSSRPNPDEIGMSGEISHHSILIKMLYNEVSRLRPAAGGTPLETTIITLWPLLKLPKLILLTTENSKIKFWKFCKTWALFKLTITKKKN